MGCVKSKHRNLTQDASSVEKASCKQAKEAGEQTDLVKVEAGLKAGLGEDSLQVNPALLDYAQRLSVEIVTRAVKQWVELDSRYSDIPYIECDLP